MSGASQPHKHIQFAPMAGEGSIGHFPTEKAAEAHDFQGSDPDKPFSLQELPYVHHIRRLNPPPCPHPLKATKEKLLPTMRYLQEAYLSLLDAMLDDLRLLHHANPDLVPDDKLKLGSGLSYNLLMTKKHMHIIARREATYLMDDPEHSDKQEGQDSLKPSQEPTDKAGSTPSGKAVTEPAIIGCNSLAYTGTVLVKSSEDAKKLSKQGGVLAALKHCGFPKPSTVMADTHHD
jgi:ATP adenylyltransferase